MFQIFCAFLVREKSKIVISTIVELIPGSRGANSIERSEVKRVW